MKKGVSKIEVYDFKSNWCDENGIIIKLIKDRASNYFVPPILDVGTGLRDIAYFAFREKAAICIDVNNISDDEFPISKYHRKEQVDFFKYIPDRQIKTVLISHTLQFLDGDVRALNKKINEINSEYLILVLNDNTDFMGEIIDWTKKNFDNANPEVHLEHFPVGYSLIKRIPFKAKLQCPDFDKLIKQISYLMVIDLKDKVAELKKFLISKLAAKAEFSFKQAIEIYKKDER